jgi:ATP-binding cassette subfamily B protein
MQLLFLAWSLDLALWPVIIGKLLDGLEAIASHRQDLWSSLHTLIYYALALWIGVQIALRIAGYMWASLVPKMEAEVRMEMFEYVHGHSHHYFSENLSGSVAYNINLMVMSFTTMLDIVVTAFLPTAGLIAIAAVLFFNISFAFAAIFIGWIVIHMYTSILMAPACCIAAQEHSQVKANLQGSIVDSLSNYISVKLFAHEDAERSYIDKKQQKEIKVYQYSEKVSLNVITWLGIITFLGAGIGLHGYILYAWKQGWATLGEVIFAINTTWSAVTMTWWVGTSIPQVFNLWGACRQALTTIQVAHDIVDSPEAVELEVSHGEIAFEGVSFGYPEKQLFDNKTLIIHHGEKIGLVGYSGAGKTTFIQLILRFFNVEHGRILIDGHDISNATITSLRKNIAVIPQDPQLFHRSLMDNIRYGRLEATDEDVIHASKLAHCHEFIEKLPEQYQTVIGKKGIKLSGGQKQRVAIARAFLSKARILILDEATSALDSKTEAEIQESLNKLMQGRTTLVIAHRLSTLRGLDRILVFHEGKIVEQGSHAALIATGGVYSNMWKLQSGGLMPDAFPQDFEEKTPDII